MTAVNIDKTDMDLDQRLRQLMDFDPATSYAKQKESITSLNPFLLHFLAISH